MMGRGIRLATGALLAAAVAAAMVGSAALGAGDSARAIACGSVLTANVKLSTDLNCTGDGLIIGANNIKVDLVGHTINGDGGASDTGVDNPSGYRRVTITNGKITHFGVGVYLAGGADQSTISNLTLRSIGGSGIDVADAEGVQVTDNAVLQSTGPGILIEYPSLGVSVKGNRIVGLPAEPGIRVTADTTAVTGNFVTASENGIAVTGDFATITGNTIMSSTENGIELNPSTGTVIGSNQVIGSGLYGVSVIDAPNAQVTKNTVNGNYVGGILVDGSTATVSGNTVTGNAGDGLDACTSGISLSKNTANANGASGILKTAGVTSTGDKAFDNAYQDVEVGDCA